MKKKRSFSFNEEQEAEYIYHNGFSNGIIDYGKMYLVAKYIRQTFDFGEIRLERALTNFCKGQNKNFNPVTEAESIRKWVKSAMKYDLRKIECVSLSKTEIDTLKKIENIKERKLLFATLIFSKALKKGSVKRDKRNLKTSDNYYIHYNNFPDIIHLSKLKNVSETDMADIIHDHKPLFSFYRAERELIRLDFVDKAPATEFSICNLEDAMRYYNIFFEIKKTPAFCQNCGAEYIKNNNKQKYCKKCARNVKREMQKLLMRKRRAE